MGLLRSSWLLRLRTANALFQLRKDAVEMNGQTSQSIELMIATQLRNLEHSHDVSQTFGHPKSHALGQPAKGQS